MTSQLELLFMVMKDVLKKEKEKKQKLATKS